MEHWLLEALHWIAEHKGSIEFQSLPPQWTNFSGPRKLTISVWSTPMGYHSDKFEASRYPVLGVASVDEHFRSAYEELRGRVEAVEDTMRRSTRR